MAGNTKLLRLRIKSVSSTLQLTKAMGLVASSKVRRANEAMMKAREYTQVLGQTVSMLTADGECQKSPYMRSSGERARIIVIAGDRGLAGGYNANVFRLVATCSNAEFLPVGKRACERFGAVANSSERFSFSEALTWAKELCRDFREEKFDRLGILDTHYVSVMSQEPRLRWILPFSRPENDSRTDAVFEPDALTVLDRVAEEYVAGMLTAAVRESFACEVTARRMAMDSAGKNAKEMIDELHLEYNRARQGAITQEITEIVAGSGS